MFRNRYQITFFIIKISTFLPSDPTDEGRKGEDLDQNWFRLAEITAS